MAIDELLQAVEEAFEEYEDADEGSRGKRWRRRRRRPGRAELRRPVRWPAPHPGPLRGATCPDARRIVLQQQVHPLCDDQRRRSCDAFRGHPATNTTCRKLLRRADRNRRCRDVRDQINRECFGGGDPDHRRQARQATGGLNDCRQIYRSIGCVRRLGGRDFFEDAY